MNCHFLRVNPLNCQDLIILVAGECNQTSPGSYCNSNRLLAASNARRKQVILKDYCQQARLTYKHNIRDGNQTVPRFVQQLPKICYKFEPQQFIKILDHMQCTNNQPF